MAYIAVAVIAVLLLIPLIYELPNYVYDRKHAVLPFLRWHTPIYIALVFVLLAVLITDGLIMIHLTSTLSVFSVRLWIGIVISAVGLLYFPRLIPIYYDEKFDVGSPARALGVFVRETVAIVFFTTALFLMSVYLWSWFLDAAVGVFLFTARAHRYIRHKKKK